MRTVALRRVQGELLHLHNVVAWKWMGICSHCIVEKRRSQELRLKSDAF